MNTPHYNQSVLCHALLWLFACLIFASPLQAGDRWQYQTVDGKLFAIPPDSAFTLSLENKPSDFQWGVLELPISAEQLPALHEKRKSPNFPFIDVGVEVDQYYRTAQTRILDDELKLRIEIDHRMWDHFKRGGALVINLPEGSRIKTTLRGSNAALRKLEAHAGY